MQYTIYTRLYNFPYNIYWEMGRRLWDFRVLIMIGVRQNKARGWSVYVLSQGTHHPYQVVDVLAPDSLTVVWPINLNQSGGVLIPQY